MNFTSPPSPRPSTPNKARPSGRRLACLQCQGRKIKCDRKQPCGQCEQSGLECQGGVRKPKRGPGVYIQRNTNLRNRLNRLESMVLGMQGESQVQGLPSATEQQNFSIEPKNQEVLAAANKYVASTFWSSLASEVSALKEALEDPYNDGIDDSSSSWASTPGLSPMEQRPQNQREGFFDFILCFPGRIHEVPGALPEVDYVIQTDLCNVYIEYVDVAWKIFHIPTLRAFMQSGQQYLGVDAASPNNRALKASIHFAAISQITDRDCEAKYGTPRRALLSQLRRMAEMRLMQADLLSTTSLAALQALAIYVATSRRHDTDHRSWALFGLVIRLARASNLDRESPEETFFQRELRRRLWHHICVLDSFFAYDRGSEVSIAAGSFSRPLPSNIHDEDFDETSTSSRIKNRQGPEADMNFALMMHELYMVAHRHEDTKIRPEVSWRKRLETTQNHHSAITTKYMSHCDSSIPFQRLTVKIGRCIQAINVLSIVRPTQHRTDDSVEMSWVLELATDVLRNCEDLWQDVELNQWNRLDWVQWQPLAVALAALCLIRDTASADEAWRLVDRVMGQSVQHIADTSRGKLWQPLMKLYKKALMFRFSGATSANNNASSSATEIQDWISIPRKTSASSLQPSQESAHDNPTLGIDPSMTSAWTASIDVWHDWYSTNSIGNTALPGMQWP